MFFTLFLNTLISLSFFSSIIFFFLGVYISTLINILQKIVFVFSFKIRLSKKINKNVKKYEYVGFERFLWKPIFKKNMYTNFLSELVFWKV